MNLLGFLRPSGVRKWVAFGNVRVAFAVRISGNEAFGPFVVCAYILVRTTGRMWMQVHRWGGMNRMQAPFCWRPNWIVFVRLSRSSCRYVSKFFAASAKKEILSAASCLLSVVRCSTFFPVLVLVLVPVLAEIRRNSWALSTNRPIITDKTRRCGYKPSGMRAIIKNVGSRAFGPYCY